MGGCGSEGAAARRTSSSTMRPPGPVAITWVRSTPNSCASRRAKGEARTGASSWSGAFRRSPAKASIPAAVGPAICDLRQRAPLFRAFAVCISAHHRTSASTIRPPGPLASTCARSIPSAAAVRLARGETMTWPRARFFTSRFFASRFFASLRMTEGAVGAADGADRPVGDALPLSHTPTLPLSHSPTLPLSHTPTPPLSRAPNTWLNIPPIGALAPASTRIGPNTPSACDSTSTLTLSVSISSRGSPLRTGSPAAFSQRTTLPSVMVRPSCGM